MKLDDIIALAKQGYKPADIKELITLAEVEQKEEAEPQKKEEAEPQKKEEAEPQKKEEAEPKKEENSNDIEELKKMIAEQSSKLADSQKALEELQKGYTREDVTNNGKTPTLEDIVRDFY